MFFNDHFGSISSTVRTAEGKKTAVYFLKYIFKIANVHLKNIHRWCEVTSLVTQRTNEESETGERPCPSTLRQGKPLASIIPAAILVLHPGTLPPARVKNQDPRWPPGHAGPLMWELRQHPVGILGQGISLVNEWPCAANWPRPVIGPPPRTRQGVDCVVAMGTVLS